MAAVFATLLYRPKIRVMEWKTSGEATIRTKGFNPAAKACVPTSRLNQ